MKVVNISLDPRILDSKSAASERNCLYGGIVDEYNVVVHYPKDTVLELTPNVTVYGVGGSNKVIRLWRVTMKIRQLIKAGRCDVIVSSDPYYLGAVSYLLARIYHVGFESHILGIEKLNFMRHLVASFFIKKAGSVRVNSTRLRQRLADEFRVPFDDIAFVPIYVPTDKLGFEKKAHGTKERAEQDKLEHDFLVDYRDKFNFVFIGRLVEVKNVSMQLKAVAELKDKFPKLMLHIVGDGPLESELKAEAEELGVENNVTFHGRQDGLALGTFYRCCDSFVLTSFAEGWPMVIFEAMTSGLCVVMTDVGCAGEMICNDENGLVVKIDSHKDLAESMSRLMLEEGLQERLIKEATKNIQNYWTRDQILAGYKQSWEKAYNNRK